MARIETPTLALLGSQPQALQAFSPLETREQSLNVTQVARNPLVATPAVRCYKPLFDAMCLNFDLFAICPENLSSLSLAESFISVMSSLPKPLALYPPPTLRSNPNSSSVDQYG